MKICLCQMNIQCEDNVKNRNKVKQFFDQVYAQYIDIILLPEMCLTGFTMNIQLTRAKNNETIDFFTSLANKYNMYIGFGWTKDMLCGVNEQDNNTNKSTSPNIKAENHYTVITPSGEIISDYTKIHPFSYANEDQFFRGGDQISQFHLNDFTVSTFICYDLRFPEVFQEASKESQLIIVAANWPEARREHWRCLMRARAIENQVYMVGVNCVGEIGSTKYAGDSCIIDPQGNVLAELSYQEGLLVYDIKNDVLQYRKEFPVKQDRKLEIYKKYY